MKTEEYNRIVLALEKHGGISTNNGFLDHLQTHFPHVPKDTLWSIIEMWYRDMVMRRTPIVKRRDMYQLYKEKSSSGSLNACLELAEEFTYPPAMIAKLVLDGYVEDQKKLLPKNPPGKGHGKRQSNVCFKIRSANQLVDSDDKNFDNVTNLATGISSIDLNKFSESNSGGAGSSYNYCNISSSSSVISIIGQPFVTSSSQTVCTNATTLKKFYSQKQLYQNPLLIEDKILSQNVVFCKSIDDQFGPEADTIKTAAGVKYECKLHDCLSALNIPFLTERALRKNGEQKTPDAVLKSPMLVNGRSISWIESKALFADAYTHSMYEYKQYDPYFERYGPGMVIYWLGFAEDGIFPKDECLVMGDFPKTEQITFPV